MYPKQFRKLNSQNIFRRLDSNHLVSNLHSAHKPKTNDQNICSIEKDKTEYVTNLTITKNESKITQRNGIKVRLRIQYLT